MEQNKEEVYKQGKERNWIHKVMLNEPAKAMHQSIKRREINCCNKTR